MKKLLSLIIAVITFYGCQDDILSEEYQENVSRDPCVCGFV